MKSITCVHLVHRGFCAGLDQNVIVDSAQNEMRNRAT